MSLPSRIAFAALSLAVSSGLRAQSPPTPDTVLSTIRVGETAGTSLSPDAVAPVPVEVHTDDASFGGFVSEFDWKSVPRVRPFPRPGNFPIPPAGPGYYSLFDHIRGDFLNTPPQYPYPRFGLIQPSFYDTDRFAYLDNPKNVEFDFFDPLKRIRMGDNWQFTTGGDFRARYENHENARLMRTDNDFTLTRVRSYGDLWYRDDVRLYAEFLGAWSTPQSLAPLAIDRNDADVLNLFADLKISKSEAGPTYVRLGRQELLFGSQRLISPLEWANTRRTFQGARMFRQTESWDYDLFWVQPVVPNVTSFDSVDNNQNFAGAWMTYRPKKGQSIDAYYLLRDNTNTNTTNRIPIGQYTRHTFGGRYAAQVDNYLFDFEGAMQLGSQNGRNVVAGKGTAGVGCNFKDAPLCPTVWAYYDYASGGNPITGTAHTFNQQFPFGHYYLGWVDQVGRQNVHDLNAHLYLYPSKYVTTWLQFHSLWLADRADALYNAAGVPTRIDPSGRSGSHIGEEIDTVVNIHLSRHADLLTGYSYLFGGEFLANTAGSTRGRNAGFFFAQIGFRW